MLYKCGHVATFWTHLAASAGHEANDSLGSLPLTIMSGRISLVCCYNNDTSFRPRVASRAASDLGQPQPRADFGLSRQAFGIAQRAGLVR
jgi:hypothetical protein